jgi:hypothetical protein
MLPAREPDALRSRTALMRGRARGGRIAKFHATGDWCERAIGLARDFGSVQHDSNNVLR